MATGHDRTAHPPFTGKTNITIIAEKIFLLVLFCVVLTWYSSFYFLPVSYTSSNEPLTIANNDLVHLFSLTFALVVSTLAKPVTLLGTSKRNLF